MDFASFEKTDNIAASTQEGVSGYSQYDSSSNAISSTSDTHSCHSASSTSYPSIGENVSDQTSFNERLSYAGPQPLCKNCFFFFNIFRVSFILCSVN